MLSDFHVLIISLRVPVNFISIFLLVFCYHCHTELTVPGSPGIDGVMCRDQEQDIRTPFGPMRVVIQGERRRPAIVTYHDIGLNSKHCY